jgi:hypothetical protein
VGSAADSELKKKIGNGRREGLLTDLAAACGANRIPMPTTAMRRAGFDSGGLRSPPPSGAATGRCTRSSTCVASAHRWSSSVCRRPLYCKMGRGGCSGGRWRSKLACLVKLVRAKPGSTRLEVRGSCVLPAANVLDLVSCLRPRVVPCCDAASEDRASVPPCCEPLACDPPCREPPHGGDGLGHGPAASDPAASASATWKSCCRRTRERCVEGIGARDAAGPFKPDRLSVRVRVWISSRYK